MGDGGRPHGRALRRNRISERGRPYHLTAVTHARKPLFADFGCARQLIGIMRQFHEAGRIESLAFTVMPNHLHWLVILRDTTSLAELMRRFKAVSAREINSAVGQAGARVWQRGYHDHAIRRDEDLQTVARYIVANPLRAGLVEQIGDYSHWDAVWL